MRQAEKIKGNTILELKSKLNKALTVITRTAFIIQYFTKKLLFQIKRRAPVLKKLHLESFPAIHLKRMDWMDFLLKFSSELLVLVLCFIVSGLNIILFSGKFQDKSIAGNYIIKHPEKNNKLYVKNTSIVTVVSNSFVPQAQADSFVGLDTYGINLNEQNPVGNDIIIGDENTLLSPNPDSVEGMIAKQVKIYETQNGDTLKSIASNFGISVQTIMWANKLSSQNIKPGWQLIILPVDGVLVTATNNDTLPDIAKKYSTSLETIISYNALSNAEDITGGDLLIVPNGRMPEPAKPKNIKPKVVRDPSKIGGEGAIEQVDPAQDVIDTGDGHIFPKGYCTWYVAQKLPGKIPWGGNAKAWIANSKAYGAVVDFDPAPGTILVTNDNKYYGHVAYVEEVTPTSVIVSEMNYVKFGKVNRREIPLTSKSIKGFIHP